MGNNGLPMFLYVVTGEKFMGLKWEYQLQDPRHTLADMVERFWDVGHHIVLQDGPKATEAFTTSWGNRQVTYWPCLSPTEIALMDNAVDALVPILEGAIIAAIAAGATSVTITVPVWIPATLLVLLLGQLATRKVWEGKKPELMNIRWVCPDQASYDAVNHYFQGTWEL